MRCRVTFTARSAVPRHTWGSGSQTGGGFRRSCAQTPRKQARTLTASFAGRPTSAKPLSLNVASAATAFACRVAYVEPAAWAGADAAVSDAAVATASKTEATARRA